MTIVVKTKTRTIAELLAEGRLILEDQAKKEELCQREQNIKAQRSWNALHRAAEDVLGQELTAELPRTPPDGFNGHAVGEWILELRPFGAASIFVCFGLTREKGWVLHYVGECHFRVQAAFELATSTDGKRLPWPAKYYDTNNLAEALAVCERATAAYRECEELCRAKAQEPDTRAERQPKLNLSGPERALVLALREMIAERTGEQQ